MSLNQTLVDAVQSDNVVSIHDNREAIKAAGYKDTIILAVTNSADYPQMKKAADGDVKVNETPIISF